VSNRTGISSETASARVTLAASIITFRKQWRRTRNRSERSAAFAGVTRMTHVFRAAKLSRCPRRGGCISIFTGRRCDRVRYNASPSPPISEIFPADCVCVCVTVFGRQRTSLDSPFSIRRRSRFTNTVYRTRCADISVGELRTK